MVDSLALELASTIRHDGHGGVADDLGTAAGLAAWVVERAERLGVAEAPAVPASDRADRRGAPDLRADAADLDSVVELRQAIRALFAHAVRPGPASRADADRLPPLADSLRVVNDRAGLVPVVPRLRWPEPGTEFVPAAEADPRAVVLAAVARSAIALLSGPQREALRACTAPRCVRYFLKTHGRQEFCKPSCGNRARAARHYLRHRTG